MEEGMDLGMTCPRLFSSQQPAQLCQPLPKAVRSPVPIHGRSSPEHDTLLAAPHCGTRSGCKFKLNAVSRSLPHES